MKKLVREIIELLREQRATVATAESCTGGMLAVEFTEWPGSSAVYLGGVSAYANTAKVKLLGVSQLELDGCGAVSEEVARGMCEGIRSVLGTDFGLSVTGIAGPDGGTSSKPVGTVYCGLCGPHGTRVVKLNLNGSRDIIRRDAVSRILDEFYRDLTGSLPRQIGKETD